MKEKTKIFLENTGIYLHLVFHPGDAIKLVRKFKESHEISEKYSQDVTKMLIEAISTIKKLCKTLNESNSIIRNMD